jgi:hypothetical protein
MYKLTKNEIIELDNYWNFINIFRPDYSNSISWINNDAFTYRKYIITKIRENYTIEQFYLYEKILNKLLHNLLIHIQFDIDNICINKECKKIYKTTYNKKEGPHSYSHKLYITNLKNNINYNFFYWTQICKNDIINKIFTIMSDKNLYEKINNDKLNLKNIIISESYYYPNDYPFPNVNLIEYNNNNKDVWIKRIKAYYFMKDDSHWYKLIL